MDSKDWSKAQNRFLDWRRCMCWQRHGNRHTTRTNWEHPTTTSWRDRGSRLKFCEIYSSSILDMFFEYTFSSFLNPYSFAIFHPLSELRGYCVKKPNLSYKSITIYKFQCQEWAKFYDNCTCIFILFSPDRNLIGDEVCVQHYTVQSGDSCYNISQNFGLDNNEFMRMNNIDENCLNLQIRFFDSARK